ncbi:Ubiquitin-like domain-containing protein CIP73 [Camellia lanceoleosa]|uniref:Ubiquitin-like domain-containing protein CIP73 n=1 Tax=Camellia lanceoleosa TaxID=1840588 RepID=A0ACC0GPI8_9ERIC|nr:Ubiquitin-like domain-containing protein CIP73 [Camellia lanceoleosa]
MHLVNKYDGYTKSEHELSNGVNHALKFLLCKKLLISIRTEELFFLWTLGNKRRSRCLFRDLGALMLELHRTTMTLRMGQAPVCLCLFSPLPFQPGTSFRAIPAGTVQLGSGLTGGSPSSGFLPRNIDIRIRPGATPIGSLRSRDTFTTFIIMIFLTFNY